MGLKIWLPLDGSFDDKGSAGAKLTVPSGYNGWSSLSKIGSKSFTNGQIIMDAESTASIYNNNEMTFSFWIYPNGATGSSMVQGLIGNTGMSGQNNRKYCIYIYSNINSLHLSWQNDDPEEVTGQEDLVLSPYNCMPSYTWTHVTIAYKNPTAKIYINGKYAISVSGAMNSASYRYNTSLLNVPASLCINDLRVYDHCLSEKEVAEVAQGLVGYWPLNNNGVGAPNLINGFPTVNANFTKTGDYNFSGKMGNGDTYFFMTCSPALTSGKTYTISFDVSGLEKGVAWAFALGNNAKYTYTITKNGHHEYTFIPLSSDAGMEDLSRFLWDDKGQTNPQSTPVLFSNFKIEEGSSSSNWCPHSSKENYLTYNAFGSVEYDCSGYGSNGTKAGSLQYSSDAPRNQCATIFNNTDTYIKLPIKNILKNLLSNQCTFNFWCKEGSTSSRSVYFGGYDKSEGFNIEENGGAFRVYFNNKPNLQVASAVPAGVWTMWTVVIDTATGIKVYKNGTELTSYSGALTTPPVNINPYLGRDERDASADVWHEGSMADFRIYATCLSQEDIQELYKVSMSIDNMGRAYCFEYREV